MGSDIKIYTFIKAVDKCYFDNFIELGEICLNTVKWFREYENIDSNIGDSFEGVSFACGHDFTIEFGDPITEYNSDEELKEKLDKIEWKSIGKGINLKGVDESINANIFSLYTVFGKKNEKHEGSLVPQKFLEEFTNHRFVIILQPMTFLSRIENELIKNKRQVKRGLVKYYKLNSKIVENLSLFDKPDKYAYQKEYRIIVENPYAEQKIIQLGNLNDICAEIDISKDYIIETINEEQFSIRQKD